MNRETVFRAIYLAFGIVCLGNGLWLLVDPPGWNDMLRMLAEDYGNGTLNPHMMRKLGVAYLCISLAFFWCLVNERVRPRLHAGLTLYFVLSAGVNIADILESNAPSHRWVTDAPFIFLPPLLLLAMMIPPLPRRLRAPASGRERGKVKWFDSKKGFGFIVRGNGEELFVHYRSIEGKGHRSLREGQQVEYRLGQGAKGPQAEEVSPLNGG